MHGVRLVVSPECFLDDRESLSSRLSLRFLDQSLKIKKILGMENCIIVLKYVKGKLVIFLASRLKSFVHMQ